MIRRLGGLVCGAVLIGLWFSLGGAMLSAVAQESGAVGDVSAPVVTTTPVVSGTLPITGSPSLGLALVGMAVMAWGLAWSIASVRDTAQS